jgi:hypothetical protein
VDAMEKINKLLIKKYNSVLSDLLIGHPISKQKVSELMCLLHTLHFVGFDYNNSKETLEILSYYE